MRIHLLFILACLAGSQGAKILGVFPIGGISHYAPAEAVLKALAANGHEVTAISSYPQKKAIPNFRDIDVSGVRGISINSLSFDLVRTVLQSTMNNFYYIANISQTFCEIAFSVPQVKDLLNEDFDLVITEIFGADCSVGFAWKFKTPLISLISSKPLPWVHSRIGNPSNPSVMHQIHLDYPPRMSFLQRLVNTYYYLYYTYNYPKYHNGPSTDAISRKFFGPDVPPVNQIISNTSLILVNSHHTMDAPHPMVPNLIEIGGIHVKPSKPLPNDIKKFMDEAKNGVIYFTLGSLVRSSTLPKQTINAFRDSFALLPQKVIWKFELELENVPDNVLLGKWFPQSDILAHPNLKVYITHGGQLGTIEAVHNGVPLVGIPMFHDQHRNIRSLVDKGAAVKIGLNELTKDKIYTALKTVLSDKSYAENMKKLSRKFKDRPMTPEQTAVYWTEYVIRHKGAYHLQTAAVNMPWYQYLLVDVILFISTVLVLVIFITYSFLKYTLYGIKSIFGVKKKLE